MDSLDLNIQNYEFSELLNVFKIKTFDSSFDYKTNLTLKTNKIVDNYPSHISDFFVISKNVVLAMFSLLENNLIMQSQVEEYFAKIQDIEHLQQFNDTEIINLIINQTDLNLFKREEHKILKEPSILDTALNKPYFSIGSRVDPTIDFKNNTNEITQTFPNNVAPGNLNAIKRITQLMNVNLNSSFRTNYNQTNPCNFLYTFPDEVKNVLSMRLVSLEIPNSWYLITSNKKNNSFEIKVNVIDECTLSLKSQTHIVKIPDGNYDNESLQDYLNANYFYESATDSYLKYLKVEIASNTLRTSITVFDDNAFPDKVSFSLDFVSGLQQNVMDTLGWLLGFRLAVYNEIEECILSEGLFDAGGDRYIYLCINDFNYNNNQSNIVCFDKCILKEEVIAKIPMINGKLSMIVNDNNNSLAKIRRYNGPVNLSKIQIKVLDKFGNVIDLNNMDFSLTLEMEILYENFNFKNVSA